MPYKSMIMSMYGKKVLHNILGKNLKLAKNSVGKWSFIFTNLALSRVVENVQLLQACAAYSELLCKVMKPLEVN